MGDTVDEELPPSKLGTKEHWDMVYQREVRVFDEVGDEGEPQSSGFLWCILLPAYIFARFGESSVTKMRNWAVNHLPPSPAPLRVLECGSGNGTLLLSFLTTPSTSAWPDPTPQPFHLTGIDYSPLSATLSAQVESARRISLEEEGVDEDEEAINPVEVEWRTADLLRKDFAGEQWDLVLDKGTFDALALSQEVVEESGGRLPSIVYPERVSRLVKKGGFFLITSCNFTEDEVKRRWTKDGLGFVFHSALPHPSYSFGGKKGTTLCTVAFQKVLDLPSGSGKMSSVSTPLPPNGGSSSATGVSTNGHTHVAEDEDLFICIDVGLQLSYEIIAATVLDAIEKLPDAYRPKTNGASSKPQNGAMKSPVRFADVWVGPRWSDESSALTQPSGLPSVPILNDAHLLGGALLTHHCPWGIAVIAGTGSVVVALDVREDGDVTQIGRRGGLGYLLGDDGSAFDLGRCAIRHATDDFDAGLEVQGGLAQTIREHFGVDQTGEVLAKVYDLDPSLSPIDATNERKLRISSLSRPILEAFSRPTPDPLAVRAVHDAAKPLVESIVSMVRQVERESGATRGSRTNGTGTENGEEEGKRTNAEKRRQVRGAGLVMGGGVIRQDEYRRVVLDMLRDRGVVFGKEATVGDVAAEGVRGLVEKARVRG
ncbi:hypothetical protein JCM24511_09739 [Saitozyma sp. JCM 24511]|nr:hypothetical protein JCM24511_09739 [Saitozyma sp. JCM 24511]